MCCYQFISNLTHSLNINYLGEHWTIPLESSCTQNLDGLVTHTRKEGQEQYCINQQCIFRLNCVISGFFIIFSERYLPTCGQLELVILTGYIALNIIETQSL